jgi:hypothetical protein
MSRWSSLVLGLSLPVANSLHAVFAATASGSCWGYVHAHQQKFDMLLANHMGYCSASTFRQSTRLKLIEACGRNFMCAYRPSQKRRGSIKLKEQ